MNAAMHAEINPPRCHSHCAHSGLGDGGGWAGDRHYHSMMKAVRRVIQQHDVRNSHCGDNREYRAAITAL
jgi:hypothetical protein